MTNTILLQMHNCPLIVIQRQYQVCHMELSVRLALLYLLINKTLSMAKQSVVHSFIFNIHGQKILCSLDQIYAWPINIRPIWQHIIYLASARNLIFTLSYLYLIHMARLAFVHVTTYIFDVYEKVITVRFFAYDNPVNVVIEPIFLIANMLSLHKQCST